MSFSDRLRQARKRQGLTQEELGKKSGLSAYTIQRYEYGKLNPKKDTVAKLATALNLGYNYTKSGEPYFYTFVDTVPSPEYEGVEDFNQEQYRNAIEKALEDVTLSTIGEKIKTVRLQKGVSQAALARCLGVSTAMICQYEVGKRKPKVETLSKIAGALGVDLKVFYDDLPQTTMELKRYENIALVNEFENACFRLVNFPDSEEITEKYEKLRKKLIDRLSCM